MPARAQDAVKFGQRLLLVCQKGQDAFAKHRRKQARWKWQAYAVAPDQGQGGAAFPGFDQQQAGGINANGGDPKVLLQKVGCGPDPATHIQHPVIGCKTAEARRALGQFQPPGPQGRADGFPQGGGFVWLGELHMRFSLLLTAINLTVFHFDAHRNSCNL